MKNEKMKRILAIAGVVLLLLVFCIPMVVALSGNFDTGTFMASLAAVIFIPIMLFVILQTYRLLKKRRTENPNDRIENIIFDVGKVLLDYDWDGYMQQFGFEKEKEERITEAIFRDHLWDERDRGLYDEETYVKQMVQNAPDLEKEIREVMLHSNDALGKMDYAETWVKYLKNQGYHLYVLSNFSAFALEEWRPKLTFLKYMDGIVFSCEVKELKPEDGIYQKLLQMYQLDPAKSVFLDDRKDNCEAANRNGIATIQFENFKQAVKELEERFGVK
ncbi:MAG: HAD-IA family hydrolase [Blautia sp.]|nr:HAD-IA family hydrolase [Blautia sp.]